MDVVLCKLLYHHAMDSVVLVWCMSSALVQQTQYISVNCAIEFGHYRPCAILFCYELHIKGSQHIAREGERVGLKPTHSNVKIFHYHSAWFAVPRELMV